MTLNNTRYFLFRIHPRVALSNQQTNLPQSLRTAQLSSSEVGNNRSQPLASKTCRSGQGQKKVFFFSFHCPTSEPVFSLIRLLLLQFCFLASFHFSLAYLRQKMQSLESFVAVTMRIFLFSTADSSWA